MIFMYINDFFIEVANVQLFYKVTYKISLDEFSEKYVVIY